MWGGGDFFAARTPLVCIKGKFNHEVYREILDSTLLPFAEKLYGDLKSFVLQEDNCGPHRARTINDYLSKKGVAGMICPPQSPDCNPIENVRGFINTCLMKRTVYAKNEEEAFALAQKYWNELPESYFQNLVKSMPTRAASVLANGGGPIKY